MMSRPQNMAKHLSGATGQTVVEKKAAAVVMEVRNIAPAASGKANLATSCVEPFGKWRLAFFHLSTATNTSSAPNAKTTNTPIKFRNGKLYEVQNKK
jgi:hypothetical protein